MESRLANVLFLAVYFLHCKGFPQSLMDSPCGDWIPYKTEKCVKVAIRPGLRTKEEGELICKSYAEEFYDDVIPKLVTVKTQEEQIFLQKLIFEILPTLEHVWLGLDSEKDEAFRWNDGTDLGYTNLGKETMNDSEYHCVQMQSAGGYSSVPVMWARVNCSEKHFVACERAQPGPTALLKYVILSLKLEAARNKEDYNQKLIDSKKEFEQKLNDAKMDYNEKLNDARRESDQKIKHVKEESKQKFIESKGESQQKLNYAIREVERNLNQKITHANQRIDNANQDLSNRNPVPVGFIYVQLPGQKSPTSLWPQASWMDVGSEYKGLFFRVEGGDAAPFGELQEDNTRSLSVVDSVWYEKTDLPVVVPSDGTWSRVARSGTFSDDEFAMGLQFHLSTGEVRPRNKSVKIWQRIG